MYGIEQQLKEDLVRLRDEYGMIGVKAEFEAEGSSFDDLVRLRRITGALGVPLHLKIGGVEAFRDIKDSVTLGVDGLIAPMVESPFGLIKFLECVDKIYPRGAVRLAINVETKAAVEGLAAILDVAQGRIDGVTIGRTDLSASWLDPAVKPDTPFIMGVVREAAAAIRARGLEVTVGGSIQAASLPLFAAFGPGTAGIKALETRKVMLPAALITGPRGPEALAAALTFERHAIESKKEIADAFLADELARLAKLAGRL